MRKFTYGFISAGFVAALILPTSAATAAPRSGDDASAPDDSPAMVSPMSTRYCC